MEAIPPQRFCYPLLVEEEGGRDGAPLTSLLSLERTEGVVVKTPSGGREHDVVCLACSLDVTTETLTCWDDTDQTQTVCFVFLCEVPKNRHEQRCVHPAHNTITIIVYSHMSR